MLLLLLLLSALAGSAAAADGEHAPSQLQALAALALAAAAHLCVSAALRNTQKPKSNTQKSNASTQEKQECVLQADAELEQAASASAQLFPVGARVTLARGRGEARVESYDATEDAYDVVLAESGAKRARVGGRELVRPTVKDFYIYPIKSCGGIRLESARITGEGPL